MGNASTKESFSCDLSQTLEEKGRLWEAEAEDCNSSSDRLKADIQLLGWITTPHSWPGSVPQRLKSILRMAYLSEKGCSVITQTPCMAIHHTRLAWKPFVHMLSPKNSWGELKAPKAEELWLG